MNKYQWKIASFAKGVDPDKAIEEIENIGAKYGAITPENILEAARSNKSLLHKLFTWDNDKAAENWRLTEARRIVNNVEIITVSNGEEKHIPAYEIVIGYENKQSYKNIETFTNDDVAQIKQRTIKEINYLKQKLSFYKNLDVVVLKLEEATNLLAAS